jgi:hypothetical protein
MATPLINGESYAFATITLILFGQPIAGVTNVKFKSKQDKENHFGAGTKAVSRGRGMEDHEASLTLDMAEFWRISAASPEGKLYKIPAFDYTIVWSADNIVFHSVIVRAAEFLEQGVDTTQGDKRTTIELPLIVGDIQYS